VIWLLTAFLLFFHPAIQDLPHAFPREGAKKVEDNARVTAWDVTWEKNKSTGMHRHLYDYVGIELDDSMTKVTSPEGQTRMASLKRATAYFLPKGTTHMEEGQGDVPRHAILIDLKDTPSPSYVNKTGLPPAFPRDGARKVLENQRIVIWDYTWTPGKPVPMHFHERDVFVVFLESGELKSTTPEGQSTLRSFAANDTLFSSANHSHTEELMRGAARAIFVELK